MNELDKGPRISRKTLFRAALAVAGLTVLSRLMSKSEASQPLPAKAAGNFKIHVPSVPERVNISTGAPVPIPTETPKPLTQFDQLRQQTDPPVESVSGVNGRDSVLVESRATSDALYKIDFNDAVKDKMAMIIAGDSGSSSGGYNTSDIFVVKSVSQVPPEVGMTNIGLKADGDMGQMGSIKKDSKVYLFYLPKDSLPISSPKDQDDINWLIMDRFFRTTASGGNLLANVLVGRLDYQNLKDQKALTLIHI